ncbi:MAG TPA: glycosyltransferase family A protein, partial [Armatimonadota bacterium]|nr:glycosyltransferase family A protein [Armatimonadota bacterium]
MPCFSVIIPAYNRARFLPECLESVLAQTFTDWECIIVDDGSTDGTRELVAEYVRRDSRFRYHWQENAGASAARNAGIERARGEWIAFLDSDDWYYPDALAHFHAAASRFAEVQIVCGYLDCHIAARDEPAISVADAFHAMTYFREGIPPLSMSSAAVTPRVIAEAGGFSSAYGTAEDTEFWIRATARFEVA